MENRQLLQMHVLQITNAPFPTDIPICFSCFETKNKAGIGEHDRQLDEEYTVSHLKVIYDSYTGHFYSDLLLIIWDCRNIDQERRPPSGLCKQQSGFRNEPLMTVHSWSCTVLIFTRGASEIFMSEYSRLSRSEILRQRSVGQMGSWIVFTCGPAKTIKVAPTK